MSGGGAWWNRREVLGLAWGAMAMAACGDDGGGGGGTGRGAARAAGPATAPTTTPPAAAVFDPSVPWWLQGNFAPVTDEVEAVDLPVDGALPPELTGLYVRNGSNPRTGTSPHWFLGDGMVHGLRLDRGRARWYRNRYVRTPLYEASVGFGEGVPGGESTQSNVSAIRHGDRLLTSGEVGLPYELSPEDLSTLGPLDFGGGLTTSMTAHPKVDPATGELHFFGYGFVPPFLTYHVASPDGRLVHSTEVPVPGPTMIHDFAVTERHAVFWDLPVVFDLDLAVAMVSSGSAGDGDFPFRWDPAYGARVGLVPLGGEGGEVRWSDLPEPCYVFHGVNAFEDGDDVVVDVCRLSSVFDGGVLGGELTLRRWTVPGGGGRVAEEVVVGPDDDPGELPARDLRRTGRRHDHSYLVQNRPSEHTVDFGGLIKHDHRTGRREVWDPGPTRHSGEWLFVEDPSGTADDEGWLLSFVHDDATGSSALAVVDATDVAAGPVATVPVPQRVPYGFHAAWLPA